MIYLAADHAGYEQKEVIKKHLDELGYEYEDKGAASLDKDDDYPDYAYPAVSAIKNSEDRAILFCGSGQGMAIAANKVKGIKAAVVYDEEMAKAARLDDNANVMTVPSRFEDVTEVKRAVKTFLETEFSGAERHVRRLKKIEDYEMRDNSL